MDVYWKSVFDESRVFFLSLFGKIWNHMAMLVFETIFTSRAYRVSGALFSLRLCFTSSVHDLDGEYPNEETSMDVLSLNHHEIQHEITSQTSLKKSASSRRDSRRSCICKAIWLLIPEQFRPVLNRRAMLPAGSLEASHGSNFWIQKIAKKITSSRISDMFFFFK